MLVHWELDAATSRVSLASMYQACIVPHVSQYPLVPTGKLRGVLQHGFRGSRRGLSGRVDEVRHAVLAAPSDRACRPQHTGRPLVRGEVRCCTMKLQVCRPMHAVHDVP